MNLIGEYLVLAERVVHDSQSDQVSLFGCLEVIAAPAFPSAHPGFGVFARYRCEGEPPTEDVEVAFRVVRCSAHDGEEVVLEMPVRWRAHTRYARVGSNFAMLRVHRPEWLLFRIDHRVGEQGWQPGLSTSLDIIEAPVETRMVDGARVED